MSSARKRFVEAMQLVAGYVESHDKEHSATAGIKCARQAVEAFADAQCFNSQEDPEDHAACRAALRRECGLEE